MAKYTIRYSKLYEKWQLLRSTVLGKVVLEEFENKEDAVKCAERLRNRRR